VRSFPHDIGHFRNALEIESRRAVGKRPRSPYLSTDEVRPAAPVNLRSRGGGRSAALVDGTEMRGTASVVRCCVILWEWRFRQTWLLRRTAVDIVAGRQIASRAANATTRALRVVFGLALTTWPFTRPQRLRAFHLWAQVPPSASPQSAAEPRQRKPHFRARSARLSSDR